MAINFPDFPVLNQVFSEAGKSWKWNGSAWDTISEFVVGPTGPEGYDGFEWNPTRISPNGYQAGEIVFYQGNYYICLAENDAIPPTGALGVYWNLYSFVGPQGEAGPAGANGTDGADGVDGGFSSTQTIGVLSSNYTLTSADAGKLFYNTTAVTVTVQGLSVGQQVDFFQRGSGRITFSAGAGITIESVDGKSKTSKAYAGATIKCLLSNTYALVGDLAA